MWAAGSGIQRKTAAWWMRCSSFVHTELESNFESIAADRSPRCGRHYRAVKGGRRRDWPRVANFDGPSNRNRWLVLRSFGSKPTASTGRHQKPRENRPRAHSDSTWSIASKVERTSLRCRPQVLRARGYSPARSSRALRSRTRHSRQRTHARASNAHSSLRNSRGTRRVAQRTFRPATLR
jgi:hypothetical protein